MSDSRFASRGSLLEEKQKIQSFTDLDAWQQAHKLCIDTLQAIKDFPQVYQFGLCAQMQRAAVSIGSNIAEGFGRHSKKERLQFYRIARGSLTELQDQLLVARDIQLIQKEKFKELADQSVRAHKVLNGLIKATLSFSNSQPRAASSEQARDGS